MSKSHWVVAGLLVAGAVGSASARLLATRLNQAAAPTGGAQENSNHTPRQLLASYHGVLPCADCPGIDTQLSLYAKSADEATNGRYVLKSTYQDRNVSRAETGTWTIVHGTPDDAQATVYELKARNSGAVTNYLRVSDDEILQLDKERHRINAPFNLSLKRVSSSASLANPASQNCVKRGGKLDIRKNTAGEYGVCVFPNGKECEEWALFRNQCSPDGAKQSQ
jgi:putative hemolysin